MIDSTRRVLVVTGVVTAVFVASVFALGGPDREQLPRDLALLALNTLPLLAIRRNPVLVVLVFSAAYPLWLDTGQPAHLFQSVPTLVALYAAGGWARPAWLRAIALVGPVWMMAAALIGLWPDVDPVEIGYIAVMFVLAWVLGTVIAGRRAYACVWGSHTRGGIHSAHLGQRRSLTWMPTSDLLPQGRPDDPAWSTAAADTREPAGRRRRGGPHGTARRRLLVVDPTTEVWRAAAVRIQTHLNVHTGPVRSAQ